jgi:regulator of sirC expression with transglutaminase-like and TPR domain
MDGLERTINEARNAIERNSYDEALAILNQELIANIGEIIFLKGEIYYRLQQWGNALNQFSTYLEQFPADKSAESYCGMIQNILGFYHKDLYNP